MPRQSSREHIALTALTLAAFALRIWRLDAKGLGYDEAATAIMARAPVADIISFHWDAAFEHLPLWVLLIRGWSLLAGQSEFALRFLPAYAGVLTVPLCWALLRRIAPEKSAWRLLTTVLITTSPVLTLYAQEARMYSLVVLLAVASTYLAARLIQRTTASHTVVYVLVNWAMLGLQYYSVLLIAAHGFLAALAAVRRPAMRRFFVRTVMPAAIASVAPLLLWMALSPGFHETVAVVFREASQPELGIGAFLVELWRDISFGAFRWQPDISAIGLALLPLFIIGAAVSRVDYLRDNASSTTPTMPYCLLLLTIALLPIVISAVLFRTLATRYILYIAPFVYAFIALGIIALRRFHRVWALAAAAVTLAIAVLGLAYYFGPYQKSEYREMSHYFSERYAAAEDVLVIEAPRQHLLAKYYLGQDFPLEPVPDIPLPDYWPVTAPPVVPEEVDDQIQRYLETYSTLWAAFSAESEVDGGEFLAKYITAVSYNLDCQFWLDVRLCRFISPRIVKPDLETEIMTTVNGELTLEYARVATDPQHVVIDEGRVLFAELGWFAQTVPSIDYTVSLRLVDIAGRIVSQFDQYPIGMLLPPTVWSAGERKPGYMTLTIPPAASGRYTLQARVYDPDTLKPLSYRTSDSQPSSSAPIILGLVEIDGTIRLLPAGSGGIR